MHNGLEIHLQDFSYDDKENSSTLEPQGNQETRVRQRSFFRLRCNTRSLPYVFLADWKLEIERFILSYWLKKNTYLHDEYFFIQRSLTKKISITIPKKYMR